MRDDRQFPNLISEDVMKDKLIFNGTIISGQREDTGNGNAMVIRDEKVLHLGSLHECEQIASSEHVRVDLNGDTVVPGFNDSHCHLIETGAQLNTRDLSSMRKSEITEYLFSSKMYEENTSPRIGMGLEDGGFYQMKEEGMEDTPYHLPLILFHRSGHAAVANAPAVRSLGIQYAARDGLWHLERGKGAKSAYVIHEPYECPGILNLLQQRNRRDDRLSVNVETALTSYRNAGITSIQDNTWDPVILRYLALMARGISICSWAKGDDPESAWNMGGGIDLPLNIHIGPVKFFLDGAFSNKTAWLCDPYEGEGNWCGEGKSSREIAAFSAPFIKDRRQLAFHAIGDRAVNELCDAMEALQKRYPWIPELRIRIEHAQLIKDSDYERIRNLGMVVSCQPSACASPEKDLSLLGEDRMHKVCPHKRILNEGIPMAFGGDFPFESHMDPLAGIEQVCSRTVAESLSAHEALSAYTLGSAYAEKKEAEKGTLSKGMFADFCILSGNPISQNLGNCRVERVFYRGFEITTRPQKLSISA